LKRIVFLLIAALMVIGLIVPSSMVGAAATGIKVIIAGPMAYLQGDHMLKAAQLAASQIGTFTVNGTDYNFTVIKCDTNEISDSANAGNLLKTSLTANLDCKITIGGFRTEGVNTELPVVTNMTSLFFITGAATTTLLATQYGGTPWYPYNATQLTQKYIFRATPINSSFLVTSIFEMLVKVTQSVRHALSWDAYNATGNGTNHNNQTVEIGVFAESLTWADPMVLTLQARIPALGPVFGWHINNANIMRVSDQELKTVVDSKLNTLMANHVQVIVTVMSGPVGAVFSTEKGKLGIPAVAAGINVLAQDSNFWENTDGNCVDEITMGTWNENTNITSLTQPFVQAFKTAYGVYPSYTAGSYDVMYALKDAITAVGWNASNVQGSVDALIPWMEDISHNRTTTAGQFGYYPLRDGSTLRASYTNTPMGAYPALNSTQLNTIYGGLWDSAGLGVAHNFCMPSFTTHDVIFGPTWVTGLFIQWRKAS